MSEVAVSLAVDAHNQLSRNPHELILLPRFFGSTLLHTLCVLPSVEKGMDTERNVILFIRLEGLDVINTGSVE